MKSWTLIEFCNGNPSVFATWTQTLQGYDGFWGYDKAPLEVEWLLWWTVKNIQFLEVILYMYVFFIVFQVHICFYYLYTTVALLLLIFIRCRYNCVSPLFHLWWIPMNYIISKLFNVTKSSSKPMLFSFLFLPRAPHCWRFWFLTHRYSFSWNSLFWESPSSSWWSISSRGFFW